MTTTLIPETAPFSEEQRAWLNGFLAGPIGLPSVGESLAAQAVPEFTAAEALAAVGVSGHVGQASDEDLDHAPWHDDSLPLDERMALAEGKPLAHRLMAAMAQLDCGSCGYVCKTYGQAIACGDEKNLTLCSPGGKATKQMIKAIVQETPPALAPQTRTECEAGGAARSTNTNPTHAGSWSRKNPFSASLLESRPLNQPGSAKDTRHVVIDLAGSGLTYNVGDALGVFPTNRDELNAAIVARLKAFPDALVSSPLGREKSLVNALREDCCLK